jgi:ribonuclease VapC
VIVDSSVIVAILREEAEEDHYRRLISGAESSRLSAASYLEIGIVIDKPRDPAATRSLDDFIDQSGIAIEPVTERQARIAREAYRDYGRGSGHPAGLNFGDCFAYALARDLGEPLLFKGDDFRKTDVRPAIAR